MSSVESVTPHIASTPTSNAVSTIKSQSSVEDTQKEDLILNDKNSLQQYHLWLKEKQFRIENEKKVDEVKVENEDDENGDENFRVDALLERGPSPPESENSNSYEWSYEEQFKQLYELDADPERKSFLDEYFEYMKGRGTPVSRIPIMAKQILDLYQLYNLVVKHGGLVQVIRNKQWSKITKGLNLPTSITSAAFTLRTQYLKYLYPYECTMHNFSTPKELQAAIDSNRRDRFSTLYHTEPTMTPSRDDRYGSFPLNGCDYPGTQPRHHIPHPVLSSCQLDPRYGLKRPAESMIGKPYEKYGVDNPKVIILQDGTPSMTENRSGKVSPPPPPPFHGRPRSPIRENEIRGFPEIEAARRRSHPFPYGNKDWEGETRQLFEEEARRRILDESRAAALMCKDKNCNGIDCQYSRADYHRHRSHDGFLPTCSCTYCKDFSVRSQYSPSRRDFPPRHHMDGASAKSNDNLRAIPNGVPTSPTESNAVTNHSPSDNEKGKNEDTDTEMTTLKMKLPDIRKGGTSVQISLEICGVTYEGVIKAVHSMTNGISERNNNRTNKNNNNNNFNILEKEQTSTQMIASK